MFPSTNPSIEWLYSSFREILRSCISAIGFQVKEGVAYERRFYFKDESLVQFEEARQRYDAGKSDDGELIGQLSDITFGLWADTKLALGFISETFKEEHGPACAIRNFARTLFSEIEGCVFVAAFSLFRYRGYAEPTEELLIGSHEEVRARIVSTLEAFSQEFGTSLLLEKGGLAWDKFLAARELRNRLTHPKGASDLDLSVGDMEMMMEVSTWWHSSVDGCFELNGQKLP
jgi:hypothetical protein